jgi:uncharacterized membrane protein affecting hemolysin expression
MTPRMATVIALCLCVCALIVLDFAVWRVGDHRATVTAIVRDALRSHALVRFTLALVVAHLFAPADELRLEWLPVVLAVAVAWAVWP